MYSRSGLATAWGVTRVRSVDQSEPLKLKPWTSASVCCPHCGYEWEAVFYRGTNQLKCNHCDTISDVIIEKYSGEEYLELEGQ